MAEKNVDNRLCEIEGQAQRHFERIRELEVDVKNLRERIDNVHEYAKTRIDNHLDWHPQSGTWFWFGAFIVTLLWQLLNGAGFIK